MAKKKEKFNSMTDVELVKKLASFREDLRVLRFKAEGAKSGNTKEAGAIRRNIARVMTAIKQK